MNTSPFFNWAALKEAFMPMPDGTGANQKKQMEAWNDRALYYNKMTELERPYTLKQLDCIETAPEDTVLDLCCGPGRIVVPMASRVRSVTALDASENMLAHCRRHAEEAGRTNINYVHMDWNDVIPDDNVEKHDIVISSRSGAIGDVDKMSALARKLVVYIVWHHGCPSLPQVINKLFVGVDDKPDARNMHNRHDRRLGDNMLYNCIYDMGYDVNMHILDDGYTQTYATREEAYADLALLYDMRGPKLPESGLPRFRENVDRYLTENSNGTFTFLIETGSVIYWWKPEKHE